MSSGLMSCVRENSPPLELDMSATGPLSLPEGNSRTHVLPVALTSTPVGSPTAAAVAATASDGNDANAMPNAEQQQQKRRRFHPLRNLRRIFRRRTINSAADSTAAAATGTASACQTSTGLCNTLPPPASSSSEKNLRCATLASSSTASSSSPTSPMTHQQLQDSYQTQSLPKSKSYSAHRDELLSVILGKKKTGKQATPLAEHPELQQDDMYSGAATTAAYQQQHHHHHHHQQQQQQQQQRYLQRQSLGVAVFPDSMNRSFYTERQQLRSVGDSSQELDTEAAQLSGLATNSGDMSDSQRSLSEGRLLDGDYTREALSQSHDSVFSETATASSLSIVLKAELTDVLRKRRNRPDASDEDLGLPRSPASPQRRAATSRTAAGSVGGLPRSAAARSAHTSELNSSSLLSMNSTDGEDTHSHSHSHSEDRRHNSRISTSSSISMSSDILRSHNDDEVDLTGMERQRLSHAAAKHKMAIRPPKKKGPSRQHRRTLETSIPEANEELLKLGQLQAQQLKIAYDEDHKAKTRSLPPGINAKTVSSASAVTTATTATTSTINSASSSSNRSKTIELSKDKEQVQATTVTVKKSQHKTMAVATSTSGLRALTSKAASVFFDSRNESSTDDVTESSESGFLSRLIHRNSKRSIARANDGLEDVDSSQSVAKKMQISTSCHEVASRDPLLVPNKSRSATSHEQNIQETRQLIKREIHNEGKVGYNAMVNNFGTQPQPPTSVKPKSGPAARQRYLPQELGSPSGTLEKLHASDSNGSGSFVDEEVISVTNFLSKSARGNDTFQSTNMVRDVQRAASSSSPLKTKVEGHFERKARIVGLSAFQQKLSRSSESFGQHSSSSNSLETSTDEPSLLYYEEKQRKTVEKSRSFRNYEDEREVAHGTMAGGVHNNMPSLPDLSLSFRVPAYYSDLAKSPQSPQTPASPSAKCMSLGFEINDNKLMHSTPPHTRCESTGQLQSSPAKKKGQHTTTTKLLNASSMVPSLSPTSSTNISEIEQNIDLIVKSPFISVLRKSAAVNEEPAATDGIGAVELKKPLQRPKMLDLKQTTTSMAGKLGASSPLAKTTHSPPTTPGAEPCKSPSGKSSRNSGNADAMEQLDTGVPEFMKIQLNRVDQARLHKTNHVVLAKNVKPEPSERSQSTDDLSLRRHSSENAGGERESAAKPAALVSPQPQSPQLPPNSISPQFDAIGKQQRAISANSVRSSYASNSSSSSSSSSSSGGSSEVLTPRSPTKTTTTPKTATAMPTTVPVKPMEQSKADSPSNRLSLEERKRLFLGEEKTQADRRMAELRNERKKSINEDLQRKSLVPTQAEAVTPTVAAAATPTPTTPVTPEISEQSHNNNNNNTVMLRKKSIAIANGSPSAANKDDATPELMKVFARRSLKVKDDDLVSCGLTQPAVGNGNAVTPVTPKKMSNSQPPLQQNVDSDKENQSNSEEKLDKLTPKYDNSLASSDAGNKAAAYTNNRNSVADFRNLNNHNNNNNNSSNSSNGNNGQSSVTAQQKLAYLPPIKVSNSRNASHSASGVNNNNNNNNHHNNSSNNNNNTAGNSSIKPNNTERYSLQLMKRSNGNAPAAATSVASSAAAATTAAVAGVANTALPTKSIERSATVGEFKGIHQRRAEWEQRAKEALK